MRLSEEQNMIANLAEAFSKDQLRPNAERWDRDKIMDRHVLRQLAELGFGGIYCGEQYGGSGLGRLDAVLIFEQLAKGCVSHASFCLSTIWRHGWSIGLQTTTFARNLFRSSHRRR